MIAAFAVLTLVTGLVDAVSILALGQVFVANMTGNVVFLAFAVAGVETFSAARSATAVGSFICGALLAGVLANRLSLVRRHRTAALVALAWVPLAAAALVHSLGEPGHRHDLRVIALLAVAMGVQNAMARRARIADMTTTLLTLTMTGLASESALAGGGNPRWRRRVAVLGLLFSGALVGALLVRVDHAALALWFAVALMAVAALMLLREVELEEYRSQERS